MSATIKAALEEARENYAAQLKQLSQSPKLTYSAEGRSFSWTEYQNYLIEKIKELQLMIDGESGGDEIVEEISQLYT